MTVWLLVGRFAIGGLERVQIQVAQALQQHGIDVELVVGTLHPDGRAGIPSHVHTRTIAEAGRAWFPFALARALSRHRPDVVFTTANDVACLALLAKVILRLPSHVVVTQHSSISGPRTAARGLQRLKADTIRWLLSRLIGLASAVVAVSQAVARDVADELALDEDRIDVIYNPAVLPATATAMHEPSPWPWPPSDMPTVVFVGRLDKVKRLDLLLDAFARSRVRIDARLLIVGSGPQQSMVQTAITELGLDPHCTMLGHADNPLPYIRRSDVLVLPSDYEGFGLVLVEAMACGTQVVATDCPDGPAEILDHGRYGQLVPCGDAIALADAIYAALSGTKHVPANVLRARAAEFSYERAAAAYTRLVDTLSTHESGT